MVDLTPYIQCINQVHPTMVQKIIAIESGNNPLAININKKAGIQPKYSQPKTKKEAIQLANYYIKKGHSVDIGYMQINSNNFKHYNVSIYDMFNPCKNISIGTTILLEAYQQSIKKYHHPQKALRHALSIYNTGNMYRGLNNGYVQKYTKLKINLQKVHRSNVTISTDNLYDQNK